MTELQQAQASLVLWQDALDNLPVRGQNYMVGRVQVNYDDSGKCLRMVKYYQNEIARLTAGRARGPRTMYGVPRG